jgi:flagellar hook-basal body complex protein FliE
MGMTSGIEPGRLLQLRSAILNQNQALQRAAGNPAAGAAEGPDGGSFGQTLADAVRAVNDQQIKASAISESYERGDTSDIVQVMVERQKASIGFEATLQVRNKLLSAYRDIMNMPV